METIIRNDHTLDTISGFTASNAGRLNYAQSLYYYYYFYYCYWGLTI